MDKQNEAAEPVEIQDSPSNELPASWVEVMLRGFLRSLVTEQKPAAETSKPAAEVAP